MRLDLDQKPHVSKQIMPEQIKPSPADQVLAGKTHNFLNLFPMPAPKTMDLAMFTGWFWVEGTF